MKEYMKEIYSFMKANFILYKKIKRKEGYINEKHK